MATWKLIFGKNMVSTGEKSFKCDHWNSEVETDKGLRCHEGKNYKLTLSPISQTDGHTEDFHLCT